MSLLTPFIMLRKTNLGLNLILNYFSDDILFYQNFQNKKTHYSHESYVSLSNICKTISRKIAYGFPFSKWKEEPECFMGWNGI
jgi:hypothetical protein